MSEENDPLVVDEASSADRPLVIPADVPVLPLRDTVLRLTPAGVTARSVLALQRWRPPALDRASGKGVR